MSFLRRLYLKSNKPKQDDMIPSVRVSTLTEQEYMIFMLLREGYSARESAERLQWNRRAIKKLVREVYSKLNVDTIAELIIKYKEIN